MVAVVAESGGKPPSKAKRPFRYALYRDDEFIDVGTAAEIASRRGVTTKHIRWLSTASAHKSKRKLLAYRIEEDDEEDET